MGKESLSRVSFFFGAGAAARLGTRRARVVRIAARLVGCRGRPRPYGPELAGEGVLAS
jgi:hypothetical protein